MNKLKKFDAFIKINELSSDTFKNAIAKSRENGSDNRTYNLGKLFFKSFVGKELLNGTITEIGVFSPNQGAYNNVLIVIEKIMDSNKKNTIYIEYDFNSDSYQYIKKIEMSRKDARLLSLIALKINPTSKYKEIGKEFNIKYLI